MTIAACCCCVHGVANSTDQFTASLNDNVAGLSPESRQEQICRSASRGRSGDDTEHSMHGVTNTTDDIASRSCAAGAIPESRQEQRSFQRCTRARQTHKGPHAGSQHAASLRWRREVLTSSAERSKSSETFAPASGVTNTASSMPACSTPARSTQPADCRGTGNPDMQPLQSLQQFAIASAASSRAVVPPTFFWQPRGHMQGLSSAWHMSRAQHQCSVYRLL